MRCCEAKDCAVGRQGRLERSQAGICHGGGAVGVDEEDSDGCFG